MSSSISLPASKVLTTPETSTEVNGPKYRHCNLHKFFQSAGYTHHHHIEVATRNQFNRGALINRGVNGSVGGSDVRVIAYVDGHTVDIGGLD